MFLVLELEISSNTKRYWPFSRTPSLDSDPSPSVFIGIGTRLVASSVVPKPSASPLPHPSSTSPQSHTEAPPTLLCSACGTMVEAGGIEVEQADGDADWSRAVEADRPARRWSSPTSRPIRRHVTSRPRPFPFSPSPSRSITAARGHLRSRRRHKRGSSGRSRVTEVRHHRC